MVNIDEGKYIKVCDITRQTNKVVHLETFKKYVPEYEIIKISNINCIEYEGDRQKVIDTLAARLLQINIPKDPYDVFEGFLDSYGDVLKHKFPILFQSFHEYAFDKLNRSKATDKSKGKMVSIFKNVFKCLTSILDGDIDKIKDGDLIKLMDLLGYNEIEFLNGYFNHLRKINAISLNSNIKLYYNGKIRDEDAFYTKEEWAGYINFALNIDNHIEKAMDNVTYAKCWLYMLLNQCVMWRMDDILSLPKLDNLLGIEKYGLQWFENNAYTMNDANYIIEATKRVVKTLTTHKTNTPLNFDIAEGFRIPLSISIIILENWRRRIGCDRLFGRTQKMDNAILVGSLGDEAKGFSNRKANRAVASFLNDVANELGLSGYKYVSYLRSHTQKPDSMSNITSRYIRGSYSQRDVDETLLDLYSRGPFGWLFNLLVEMGCDDDNDKTKTFKNTTNDIVALRENLSAMEIDNAAAILVNQNLTKQVVINEVILMDKKDIQGIVKDINNGLAYSKQETFECFKDECPYKLGTHCIYCEYSIPTIHSMVSIFKELRKMLDVPLSDCLYDNWRHIDKLLKLFKMVKDSMLRFGEEFLLPYINDIGFKDYGELMDGVKGKYSSYIKEDKIYGE